MSSLERLATRGGVGVMDTPRIQYPERIVGAAATD